MSDFLAACVKARLNILFSGGSGKTTTLSVLSAYMDPEERIVVIEDNLELNLKQEHVVRLLTKSPNLFSKGEIMLGELFRNTLRMRPSRIILGEIRGEEAMDYLQALNSGHQGCMAVIHASTPADVVSRLEVLALSAGINYPAWAVRQQISSGLNLIVQQEQMMDGERKILNITEVAKVENDQIVLKDIFRYKIEGVDQDGHVNGTFKACREPSFLPFLEKRGDKTKQRYLQRTLALRRTAFSQRNFEGGGPGLYICGRKQ